MANDYIAMQNRIARELRRFNTAAASRLDTEIPAAIQTAIDHYERRRFYFNTKTNTFSTVANQEYYSSSDLADIATLIKIDAARVTVSGILSPLRVVDFETIDRAQSGSVKGPPRNLTYYKQNIRPYPIPDAVYPITLAYIYRLAALSADGDSNAWTTDAEELIRQRAKKILALDVLGDGEKTADVIAQRAGVLEREALDALLSETRDRMSSPRLRVDAALQTSGGYDINTDE